MLIKSAKTFNLVVRLPAVGFELLCLETCNRTYIMLLGWFLLVCVCMCIAPTRGTPFGAPPVACGNMFPQHGPRPQPNNLGYSVQASDFVPGERMAVTVSGSSGFKGIFVQVRDFTQESVGSWEVSPGYKTITCFDNPNSALTHSNSAPKPNSVAFTWNSPPVCAGEDYMVRVTVVRSYPNFQTNIMATIKCGSRPIEPSPMMPQPPVSTPGLAGCKYTQYNAKSADYYKTSFEGSTGNWVNSKDSPWKLLSGETPSKFTGPTSAQEGNYYAYFEASSPAQPGDKAILHIDDVIGCYCFHFYFNFDVSSRGHVFSAWYGSDVMFRMDTPANGTAWMNKYFQIDSDQAKRIQLMATRGRDWVGDSAVDNVYVTPGMCKM